MAFIYNELNSSTTGDYWYANSNGLGTGPITVTQDGFILSSTSSALILAWGTYTINLNGTISTTDTAPLHVVKAGIEIYSGTFSGMNNLNVGGTGDLFGTSFGLHSEVPINIKNAGTISGEVAISVNIQGGVFAAQNAAYSITNTGIIWSTNGTQAIDANSLKGVTVTNSITGEIYGDVWLSFGSNKVTNAGLITGAVALDNLADTIINSGEIDGIVVTYQGKDSVTNSGDIFNLVDLREDDDKLVNSGIIHGDGVDVVAVYTGTGNDSVTNSGTIMGTLSLFDGNDVLANSKLISGLVDFGIGDDKLTNSGTIAGDGIDPVAVYFGDGINTMKNSGTIMGIIESGVDNDVFTNSGLIDNEIAAYTTVFMGAGNDVFTNTGTIINDVGMWDGNDTFNNTGTVIGGIWMGLGDDKFTGGKNVDKVTDDQGTDSYALGDGWDVFFAVRTAGVADGGGIDKVDGGFNKGSNPLFLNYGDVYNVFDATSSVYINADSVDHVDETTAMLLVKLQATGFEIGIDTIINFEVYAGGTVSDVIYGNASINELFGNGGDDSLHGGAGRDKIFGGDGNDHIYGDAGRDILHGDAGSDYFSYHATTESGVGVASRDLIADFIDGVDFIDFSHMNLASDHFQGIDQLFAGGGAVSAGAGAVRVLTTATGWLVQMDANGDKKVDMAIEVQDLAHSTAWDGSDFIF